MAAPALTKLRFPLAARRVHLRPPRLSDTDAILEAMADPAISLGTLRIPYPYRRADWRAYVAGAGRRRRAATGLSLVIVHTASGRAVGGVGLHDIDWSNRRAVLGYWIARPYRGQGLAAEAVSRLCRAAFSTLGLRRLKAEVFTFNRRSAKLLLGLGFRIEGRSRGVALKRGRWTDEWVLGLLRPEFHPYRARPRTPR